jgi:hypothetical protein
MSDVFAPHFGVFSLRYTLCVTSIFNLIAALCYHLGTRSLDAHIADAEQLKAERRQTT